MAVTFVNLKASRITGFSHRHLTVDGLKPGVNIVRGPNSAGKSTTATAIQSVLWLDAGLAATADIDAQVLVGGEVKHVSVRSGRLEAGPRLAAGDARDRHRYWLDLHDLLKANQGDFARAVLDEARGGFDLSGAAAALKYAPRPTVSTAPRTDLDKARQGVEKARQADSAARLAEHDLVADRARRQHAEEAGGLVPFLQKALDCIRRLRAARAAHARLSAMDPRLEGLTGSEKQDVEASRQAARAARGAETAARAAAQEAGAACSRLGLPAGGVPPAALDRAQACAANWQQAESERRGAETAASQAEARCSQALQSLGPDADPAALARVNIPDLARLADLARGSGEVADRESALRALEECLKAAAPETAVPAGLDEAIAALNAWLRTPPPAAGLPRTWLVAAGALLVGAGAVAAIFWHPAAGLCALTGFGLVAAGLKPRSASADERQTRQRDFERANLAGPAAWTPEAVDARLRELQGIQAEGKLAGARSALWASRQADVDAVAAQRTSIDALRAELTQPLGGQLRPGADGHMATALREWAENVRAWQQADADARAQKQLAGEASARADTERDGFAAAVSAFGVPVPASAQEALNALGTLRTASQEFIRQELDAASRLRAADLQKGVAEEAEARAAAIFARLGLADGDDAGLHNLLQQKAEWDAASKERVSTRAVANGACQDLSGNIPQPLPDRLPQALRTWLPDGPGEALADDAIPLPDEQAVEAALAAAQADAAGLADIGRRIGDLERQVRDAREGHGMSDAVAALAAAEAAVRAAREANVALRLGWLIKEHVEAQTRDEDLPEVFATARDLFGRITRGRYELRMDRGAGEFRAYDTNDSAERALDELSSGTRVQLLVAVRMAFVLTHETGPALPLLLDETLADSDPVRAAAAAEAVLSAIRGKPRQVLYFTCRPEEEAFWREAAKAAGMEPPHVVDLPGPGVEPGAPVAIAPPAVDVPAPSGKTRGEYAGALGVPEFDAARREHCGDLHVWHLVEDPQDVYALLCQGIATWGQFGSLLEAGAAPLPPEVCRRARAAAAVFQAAVDAACVGRSTRFTRADLDKAGVLTVERYHTELPALAERVDWDPVRFLAELRSGTIKGWRAKATDTVQEAFDALGLIADEKPLTLDEQRARVTDAASGLMELDPAGAAALLHKLLG